MNNIRDEKGRFQSGNPGRKTGARNRTKKDLEALVKALVEGNMSQIKRDLKNLKPRERVRAITELMKYCIPQKRDVNSNVRFEQLTDQQLDQVLTWIQENHES